MLVPGAHYMLEAPILGGCVEQVLLGWADSCMDGSTAVAVLVRPLGVAGINARGGVLSTSENIYIVGTPLLVTFLGGLELGCDSGIITQRDDVVHSFSCVGAVLVGGQAVLKYAALHVLVFLYP